MNRKVLFIAVIVLLSSLLIFNHLAGQTKVSSNDGCGGCCVVKAASTNQSQCCADCSMQCQNCKCCNNGPEREKYLTDTAGLRKELADARAELDTVMLKRPVDKALVISVVDRVNALQGKLNRLTAEFMVDSCCSKSDEPCCEKCRPSACLMMLADECPMKIMGCKMTKGCCPK